MNPDIMARYAANRLRIVRQVRYSSANENCIDLVLFLNGLPVATAELKTDFTQSVEDAIDQYRFDRHPRPKGQSAEPLLSFPSGRCRPFCGEQQRGPHDHAACRTCDELLALQQGRSRCKGQSTQSTTVTARAIFGKRCGNAIAGWRSLAVILSPRAMRRKRSRASFSRAITNSTPHVSCKRRFSKRARAASSSSSTRRVRARPTLSRGQRTSSPTFTTPKTKSCSIRSL